MTDQEVVGRQIIKRYELWSLGWGIVPVPFVDWVAVTAVQMRMLSQLSELYEIPFDKNQGRAILASLLGGFVPTNLAYGAARPLLKMVPVIGPIAGFFSTSLLASVSTYAVGMLFLRHFESGGTLLNFDVDGGRKEVETELGRKALAPGAGASAGNKEGSPDDLKRIEGIGPKIAELLAAGGVATYAQLAASNEAALRAILDQSGPRYRVHDPATWPRQAALAADGKWDELTALQEELKGGKPN